MVQNRRQGRVALYSYTQSGARSRTRCLQRTSEFSRSHRIRFYKWNISDWKKALVRQRKQKSDSLPLTLNSLFHHLERSNYQTFVWKHSLEAELSLTSPAVSGWKSEGENLEAVLMSKEPAPK